ncbi:MAG: ADP-ribosylglycohydrolase family protein, partial [Myxococcales bacterium]|nr:ADP-ribosylglycohydrolase family protein [Myxococcales bacterium]
RPGAVEVPSQEQWVEKFATARSKVEKKRVSARQKPTPRNATKPTVDRFLGCLLGGAMGDALGYPVEFIDSAAIQRKHGNSAPARLNYAGGKVAVVSDDTQMTLFTAEGLIRAQQRMAERGICSPIAVIGRALLRWYTTQQGSGVKRDKWPGWLVAERRLHAPRAPGNTCMSALGKIAAAGGAFPDLASLPNDSKGCGAVMRAAPIGLGVRSREIAFDFGRDSGVLTHGHPSGYLSAAYFAAVIWDLARGTDLPGAMIKADRLLAKEKGKGEMVKILARTRALATKGPPTVDAIESLGGGWTGEQALAIALLCALTHEADGADGVKRTLWTAAAHSGDSDSTAAITGNLLGAVCGAGGLPQDWLGQLEMRDVLERIAKDMHRRLIEDEALDQVAYPPN